MLGEGAVNVEGGGGGGGWRKRFNYTRESDLLVSADMVIAQNLNYKYKYKYKCKYSNKYKQVMAREYAALSEAEAANLLEEKDQDLVLAAELGNQN